MSKIIASIILAAFLLGIASLGTHLENIIRPPDNSPTAQFHPPCNPLALFRSGIGRTLSDWCEDQMDTAFHFGRGNIVHGTQTTLGDFLAALYKGSQPAQHEHAVREDKITENPLEKTRRYSSAARTESWIKWAFYLEPTNIDAYDAYIYVIVTDPRPFRIGKAGRADAINLTHYVLGLYSEDNLDDLIAKANAQVNLWLLVSQDLDKKSDAFRELTRHTEESMKREITKAQAIVADWQASGRWDTLGVAQRNRVTNRLETVSRFQDAYERHVAAWDKEKKLKPALTVPATTPKKQ